MQGSARKVRGTALDPRIVEPMENISLQVHCEKRPVARQFGRYGAPVENHRVHALQA